MERKLRTVTSSAILFSAILGIGSVYAAKAIDLSHAPLNTLKNIINTNEQLKEKSQTVAFNKTLHIRLQQEYLGYRVWGAEAIVHLPHIATPISGFNVASILNQPNASMDGMIYSDIQKDIGSIPVRSLISETKAIDLAIAQYQSDTGGAKSLIATKQIELIVFVDENSKAHWAYKVELKVPAVARNKMPSKPVYILDALDAKVYAKWDEIKTSHVEVSGGGYGGNKKMGKLSYDGLSSYERHLAKLTVDRDDAAKRCYLKNSEVIVKEFESETVSSFVCNKVNDKHNNVYWSGNLGAINDGYSPDNDALFGGQVIKAMYQSWYGIPVLSRNGKPMLLEMVVHDPIENAFWDGEKMTFGDGEDTFYPLTSLGVAAHEVSHGFTEQHSDLVYYGQSGGMNESFSDMAAQAAEIFAYNSNSWMIGPEIMKSKNEALRYMDKPSKDCKGGSPGDWCSIDSADQYYSGLDVHFSSGVYNHFFYLLATTKGWDVRKAFDVMLHANSHYWISSTNYKSGACGVLKAAADLKYDTAGVKAAFDGVKIDTSNC